MKLAVDASVALPECVRADAFETLVKYDLVAPPLLWSEVRSGLHEAAWRGELPVDVAKRAQQRIDSAPIERRSPRRLGQRAWELADEFGWAKTYDAEYVALAALIGCRLVTFDARLRRGTQRLGFVVAPHEL